MFSVHNFNLCDVFQECNPGVKQDLPVLCELHDDLLSHSSVHIQIESKCTKLEF